MADADVATDLDRFLDAFRASKIVPEGRFEKVLARLPATVSDATSVADALVAAGTLTRFQADRLLMGKPDGFLFGPYVFLEPISKGPTGRVYKARHRTMTRLVAVKVLDAARTNAATDRDAILAEAKAAARVTHPNLVGVVDVNRIGDRAYFVLEYVDGVTLAAAMAEAGPLPVAVACRLGRAAAQGLAAAHAKELVHGGVSPDNLMVGRHLAADDGPVKWLNAGQTRLRELAGVTAEAAVYRDSGAGGAGPAGDAYGLGAILYLLLTGQPPVPFHRQNASREPLPVDRVRPDVPAAVLTLVTRLMADAPADRPTPAAVAAVLEPFGEVVPATAAVDFDTPPPAEKQRHPAEMQALVETMYDAEVITPPPESAPPRPRPQPPVPPAPKRPPARRPRTTGPAWVPYGVAAAAVGLTFAAVVLVLRFVLR
jgi:serine/threonine-protein kinase